MTIHTPDLFDAIAEAEAEASYPSAPIEGETKATVDLVGNDWRSDEDWLRFESAVKFEAAYTGGVIDPTGVRAHLTRFNGELTINPRRLSAFYSRAVAQGLIEFSHWGINGDAKGRNKGKPQRMYRLRT